ncbi:3-hydroxyacyl-ACP dehydratase FabZ family protein [Saccharopolyspora sp. 5N708]|uniref:3-hydroxyacyl-ACP dehydratase FabZ family protein n=1 Tax=Saccharopolyspora sp. 5N708 TaxID=3457424 RepID=UPI003FCF5BBD
MTETTNRQLGFSELKQLLRHRHPMIYIDRVTNYEPGSHLQSVLSVSANLDSIAGHFPERAIFPGSHLMQAFAQSGIVFYQLSTQPLTDDEITLIGSVKSRFTGIVVPGDRVLFDLRQDRLQDNVFFFSANATVDGRRMAAFSGNLIRTTIQRLGRQLW